MSAAVPPRSGTGAPGLPDLLDQMLAAGASDLHLSPGLPPMVRVSGQLAPLPDTRVLSGPAIGALVDAVLTEPQRQIYSAEHDLDFAYAHGTRARFRGNLLHKTAGTGAVFRVIPTRIPRLSDMNMPAALQALAASRTGLVLVTGPTGSGKSTTLAGMLDAINRDRDGHILTVEDPVEFVHTPQRCQITHREVGRDVPTFAAALRSAGREDVDVLLVGELRQAETMRLALQAASSGVLVFATVHTNSAGATIDRVVNAFSADEQPAVRGMLAEGLAGVVAQQLVRRADGPGRVAVQEILVGTRAVASVIREGKTMMLSSVMQAGRAEGMQTLDWALEGLVQAGTIAAREALAKASDKESFARLPAIAAQLAAGR